MWSILENVPCALEKMYSSKFEWNVLKISMRSISSNVSFKTFVFLLIFCFGDMSLGVSGVLKSPTIIVLLSFSPFRSVSVCLMYWGAPMLVASVQFSSVTQLCLTPCDPMNCSTTGLPVHHQLLEFAQTHVHWVGDAIQPSHPLWCIDIYNCYGFLLEWSLEHYLVSFLVSCNVLYFKVFFVWYEDCCSSFLLLLIFMEHIFPSSQFQSICVFRSEVCFL